MTDPTSRMFSDPSRRQAGALLLALTAAVVAACGGGGDAGTAADAAAGGVQSTAFAAGPIAGFGSIIVNGVRYDDSAASVIDDDDAGHDREKLKLGMMVEIDGHSVDAARALGKAMRIRFGSEIVGPVAAVDAAARSLVVLGQTVLVTETTVFDDSLAGGLGALSVGAVIEVHAQFDAATAKYSATRIEPKADATAYRLRGVVANLDTAAKTFTVGGEIINYAGVAAAALPNKLANGMRVRVRLQTTQVSGQWVATALRAGLRKPEDRAAAHMRGIVSAYTTATDFELNGLKVDASGASFPDGSAGIVLGARIEVHGKIANGVLVATKVELEERHVLEGLRFELHGQISALDMTAKTFRLRGLTVGYGGEVTFKDGTAADLADGRKVEVKGRLGSSPNRIEASKIDFE